MLMGGQPDGMAMSPDGALLAIALRDTGRVALFNVGVGGSLTTVSGWPAVVSGIDSSGPLAFLPQRHADGNWTLVAGESPLGSPASITLVAARSGGPLTRGSLDLGATGGTQAIAVTNGGDRLVITLPGADAVAVLNGALSGTLSQAPGSPASVLRNPAQPADQPAGLALGPNGRIVHVTCRTTSNVVSFLLAADGQPSLVDAPPEPTGLPGMFLSLGIVYAPADDPDGDGIDSVRDNCPTTANPGQEDSNLDRFGDACQPAVRIGAVASDALDDPASSPSPIPVLTAGIAAADPDGQPLAGQVVVAGRDTLSVTLLEAIALRPNGAGESVDCSRGLALEARPAGEGIAYAGTSASGPALLDQDSFLDCNDGIQDFELAIGGCSDPNLFYAEAVGFPGSTPFNVCVRMRSDPARKFGVRVDSVTDTSADVVAEVDAARITATYSGTNPPVRVPLAPLGAPPSDPEGSPQVASMSADDGITTAAIGRADFAWRGEDSLLLGRIPVVLGTGERVVDCSSSGETPVSLDARSFTSISGPTVTYTWLKNQTTLATGELVAVLVTSGTHSMVLEVRDSGALVESWPFQLTVRDTAPPSLTPVATPATLTPADGTMRTVNVTIAASDACSSSLTVTLISAVSSEPDDAPGNCDGRTTGDIQGATIGTDDRQILLRAERCSSGSGRTYTLTYRATDGAGNSTTASTTVRVPL
jgi:hypothetical protein